MQLLKIGMKILLLIKNGLYKKGLRDSSKFLYGVCKQKCLPTPVKGRPLFHTGKVLGLGHCSPNFAHDGYCDNARGRDEVFNGTLGWAVTFKSLFMLHLDLQRFPGPVCGSCVLLPPTLVFWGSISRMSVTMGSILMAPISQHCLLSPATTRSQDLVHPSPWVGHLGLSSPPLGLCHSGCSISSLSLWTWPSPIYHLLHLHLPRFRLIWPLGPCTW